MYRYNKHLSEIQSMQSRSPTYTANLLHNPFMAIVLAVEQCVVVWETVLGWTVHARSEQYVRAIARLQSMCTLGREELYKLAHPG